jgi:hypothetical protein
MDGSPLKYFTVFDGKQSLLERRGKELDTVAGAERMSKSAQYSPVSPGTLVSTATRLEVPDSFAAKEDATVKELSKIPEPGMMMPPPFKHVRSVTAPPGMSRLAAVTASSDMDQGLTKEADDVELSLSLSSDHDSFYSAEEYDDGAVEESKDQMPPFRPPSIAVSSATEMSPPETPRPLNTPFVRDPETPRLTHSSGSEQTNISVSTAPEVSALDTEIRGLKQRKPFLPIIISSSSASSSSDPPLTPEPSTSQPLSILSPVFPSPSKNAQNGVASHTLMQKACALLVGTPAHLVVMMLRIAARILRKLPGGEKGLELLTMHIPGGWDPDWDEEDEEDDFGVSLNNARSVSLEEDDEAGHDQLGDGEVE